MKIINGVNAPTQFDEATGSWILFTAAVTCGLCLRGKQRARMYPELTVAERQTKIATESYFVLPTDALPLWSNSGAKRQRWTAYKRHIKTVHGGNWNLNQGFGAKPPVK